IDASCEGIVSPVILVASPLNCFIASIVLFTSPVASRYDFPTSFVINVASSSFCSSSKFISLKMTSPLVGAAVCDQIGKALSAALIAFRSEEHTSELQSRFDLVCRLLLEKKNKLMTDNTFANHKSSHRTTLLK